MIEIGQTLSLPGLEIAPRNLTLLPDTTDAQLIHASTQLTTLTDYGNWGLASVLSALQTRKGDDWLSAHCEAIGLPAKKRRELLIVHTFYVERPYNLSYDHYREALLLTPPTAKNRLKHALESLKTASSQSLKLGPFRRHLRASLATHPPHQVESPIADYATALAFNRFAHRALPSISSWPKDRIALFLSDMSSAIELLDRLRSIHSLSTNAR